MIHGRLWAVALGLVVGWTAMSRGQAPVEAPPSAPDTGPTATPSVESTEPGKGLPHIRIDREEGVVEVEAKVVLREGQWIELLACSQGTQEHESLVAVLARPSHIHLALLTLGLEPGDPVKVEKTDEGFKTHPPHGPRVAVSFVYDQDGQRREVPAHQWVVNQQTGEVMDDARFLFTGSDLVDYEGKRIYMADLSGAVVTLVSFGDDLVARDTTQTNRSDNQAWNANTARIPPLGTPVTLRLRPLSDKDD